MLSRRFGWHVELLGWEDTLPGHSRPQDLINKDVDTCDLFIGILWCRWGQETGKYSSGFEEEFTRAQTRRRDTGSPEIWLFFKAVEEERLKDPGDQLKRVLNFKEVITSNKELMFKGFSNSAHWEKVIYDDLLQYVLDLSSKKSELESREEALLAGQAKEIHVEKSKAGVVLEAYPSEIIKLFGLVSTKLKERKQSEIDISDRTRLYLQSSAWFSESHLGEVFDNHETNLAFTHRKDWKLSNSEVLFLVRSFISDMQGNRPGWYWVKEWSEDRINNTITDIAINDLNTNVRRAAFSLLADVGFKASRDVLEKGLTDTDKQVILEAIRLFRNNDNSTAIDLIDKVLISDDSDIRESARAAKIDMMYLSNPNDAISYLIFSRAKITPLIKKTIDDLSFTADHKLLKEALQRADVTVRRFSAQYLRKINLLTQDTCYELLKDTDAVVRKEALLELISQGKEIDMDFVRSLFSKRGEEGKNLLSGAIEEMHADEFLPLLLKKRDPKELLESLDFFDNNSQEAYRILAEDYFSLIESRIRVDLDNSFGTFIQESQARLREKYGPIEGLYKTDLIEFMRDRFIAAAMDGLARNGKLEDVKYARKYLGNTTYNKADNGAILLLSKFGDTSDVDSLIKAALRNYGETRKLALETAYALVDDKDALLERLVNDKDKSVAEIAMQKLWKHESDRKLAITLELLESEVDERRIQALSIFAHQCNYNSSELEDLLDVYISRQSYYYNIVTWLDRCLYTKGQYYKYFESKLSSILAVG